MLYRSMFLVALLLLNAPSLFADGGSEAVPPTAGERVAITVTKCPDAEEAVADVCREWRAGEAVAQDRRTVTVRTDPSGDIRRYPLSDVRLSGTVVSCDESWLVLDLGDGSRHVHVPRPAIGEPEALTIPIADGFPLRRGQIVRLRTTVKQVLCDDDACVRFSRLTGKVLGLDDTTLLLRLRGYPEPIRVPLSSITRLDIRHRRAGTTKGTLLGGFTGFGLGLNVYVFLAMAAGDPEADNGLHDRVGRPAMLLGTVAGALIGSRLRINQWESVQVDRLRLSIAPQPHGGMAAALSLRF